ncbi:MAG: metallophosphoesterase, partial [Epsilonproteobacteria bacterium]|nr:metallophosphoesterase [Campylobacterota bacterium]
MVKNALKTPHLPSEDEYMVIGDIHGCIDELQQLLIQNGFQINHQGLIETTPLTDNRSIILLGDFIDKASSSKLTETIEFIYHNYFHLNQKRQQFYLIMGNHEQMVYRYITNDTTLEVTPKRLSDKEKYYNTVALLETNSVLKAKFLELYEECFTWLKYSHSEAFSVTLTHAPCPVEHLGKEDETSVNKMIKCTSRSKNPDMRLDDL